MQGANYDFNTDFLVLQLGKTLSTYVFKIVFQIKLLWTEAFFLSFL